MKHEASALVSSLVVEVLDTLAEVFPAILEARDSDMIRLEERLEVVFSKVLEK